MPWQQNGSAHAHTHTSNEHPKAHARYSMRHACDTQRIEALHEAKAQHKPDTHSCVCTRCTQAATLKTIFVAVGHAMLCFITAALTSLMATQTVTGRHHIASAQCDTHNKQTICTAHSIAMQTSAHSFAMHSTAQYKKTHKPRTCHNNTQTTHPMPHAMLSRTSRKQTATQNTAEAQNQ